MHHLLTDTGIASLPRTVLWPLPHPHPHSPVPRVRTHQCRPWRSVPSWAGVWVDFQNGLVLCLSTPFSHLLKDRDTGFQRGSLNTRPWTHAVKGRLGLNRPGAGAGGSATRHTGWLSSCQRDSPLPSFCSVRLVVIRLLAYFETGPPRHSLHSQVDHELESILLSQPLKC